MQNRKREWGSLLLWEMANKDTYTMLVATDQTCRSLKNTYKRELKRQVSALLTTLEREEQKAPKQGTTSLACPGDLRGGGPKKKQATKGHKQQEVANNPRELSGAELRKVLEKWAPKWGGSRKMPGVVDRGSLKTWAKEIVSEQLESPFVITNTKAETTGAEVGHWLMVEYEEQGRVRIWDPLAHPVGEMKTVIRILEDEGSQSEHAMWESKKMGGHVDTTC